MVISSNHLPQLHRKHCLEEVEIPRYYPFLCIEKLRTFFTPVLFRRALFEATFTSDMLLFFIQNIIILSIVLADSFQKIFTHYNHETQLATLTPDHLIILVDLFSSSLPLISPINQPYLPPSKDTTRKMGYFFTKQQKPTSNKY